MANLMTSMWTGVSGLNVSQNAINTTAHNLANVDTKGFVRQQTVMKDFLYGTIGRSANSTMQVGLGTATAIVRQVRHRFLDKQYREEVGRLGYYDSHSESIMELEDLFGELEGVAFEDNINAYWNATQELHKNSDDITIRANYVKMAESLLERAKVISEQVNDYQVNLNQRIIDKVDRINEIGAQIKDLNAKIKQFEASGQEQANDYRDLRNVYLDELGQLVDITYSEDQNGVVNISVEGQQFLNAEFLAKMGVDRVDPTSKLVKPVWETYSMDVFDISRIPSYDNASDIGSLKGLIAARGSYQAKYTDIPKRDQYASELLYDQAVADYNVKVDLSSIMKVQAEFDQLMHGIVTRINDLLAPNTTITDSAGVTYVILDESKAPRGLDENKTMGEALFNRVGVDRYTETWIDTDNDGSPDKKVFVYTEEDPSDEKTLFTIDNLEINKNILKNYSYLPLNRNDNTGQYDKELVDKMVDMWNDKFDSLNPNTLAKSTFKDYYTDMVGDLANRGNTMHSITENQNILVEMKDNSRMNVMGVSSDEELTNLIKFQHAYNASSRYITVISDMLEHIVTRL